MKTLAVLEKVLKGKRLAELSARNYRQALGSLAEYSEEFPVKGAVINEWLASLVGLADTTVRLRYVLVREAGEYMRKNYDVKNPCDTIECPQVKKKKRRYWSPVQLMKLVSVAESDLDKCLVLGLIDSCCRVGELAGLKGKDVNADEEYIDVKGKTGERRYRLAKHLCVMFKALAGSDEGYVFTRSDGKPYDSSELSKRVIALAKHAGMTGKKLGAHTIRHSSGTMVAKFTRDVFAVKSLLQHDDIKSSMSYIHDVEEEGFQGLSPVDLMMKGVKEATGSQPLMLEEVAGADGEFSVVSEDKVFEDDGLEDLMREVGSDVKVRPLLKGEDLALVRRSFIGYLRAGVNGDRAKCIALYNRLLRKVK